MFARRKKELAKPINIIQNKEKKTTLPERKKELARNPFQPNLSTVETKTSKVNKMKGFEREREREREREFDSFARAYSPSSTSVIFIGPLGYLEYVGVFETHPAAFFPPRFLLCVVLHIFSFAVGGVVNFIISAVSFHSF